MTGELVDLFENRDDGVKQIIQTMTSCCRIAKLLYLQAKKAS